MAISDERLNAAFENLRAGDGNICRSVPVDLEERLLRQHAAQNSGASFRHRLSILLAVAIAISGGVSAIAASGVLRQFRATLVRHRPGNPPAEGVRRISADPRAKDVRAVPADRPGEGQADQPRSPTERDHERSSRPVLSVPVEPSRRADHPRE